MIETLYENKSFTYDDKDNLEEYNVRRLNPNDYYNLNLKEDDNNNGTSLIFGDVNLKDKMCNCFLTLGIEKEKDQIIGIICLHIYPNVPSILPELSTTCFKNLYNIDTKMLKDTLWIHYVWYETIHERFFLLAGMRKLFLKFWLLEAVAVIVPPARNIKNIAWLRRNAIQIRAHSNPKGQSIYIIKRAFCMNAYRVRWAVEEDNDDLIPLIERESATLREIYGEYYIAEILTRHPEIDRKIIIAEYESKAIAVFGLNKTINYDLLNSNFELSVFRNLKKTLEWPSIYEREEQDEYVDEEQHFIYEPENDGIEEIQFWKTYTSINTLSCDTESRSTLQCMRLWKSKSRVHRSERNFLADLIQSYFGEFEEKSPSEAGSECEGKDSNSTIASSDEVNLQHKSIVDDFKTMNRFLSRYQERVENVVQIKDYIRPQEKLKKYGGLPNAFVIEIATCDSLYVDSYKLLLQGAFECYPDNDYCILSCPPETVHPELRQYFVKATPKPNSNFPYDLFVLHRCSLKSNVHVRMVNFLKVYEIEEFAWNLINKENLINYLENTFFDYDKNDVKIFVMEQEHVILGLTVIRSMDVWDYVVDKYSLYEYEDVQICRADDVGIIEYFICSPIFLQKASLFMREIFRLGDYKALFHMLKYSEHYVEKLERSYCCLIDQMVGVKRSTDLNPIKMKNYNSIEPFALFLTTPRLLTTTTIYVDCRIVILGGSNAAISLLERLFFNTNTRLVFTNVTLVSNITIDEQIDKIYELMFVESISRSTKKPRIMTLKTYCNFVNDTAVKIDRNNRYLYLMNGTTIYYDKLIITCGKQFQTPRNIRQTHVDSNEKNAIPLNVFTINTFADAKDSIRLTLFWKRQINRRFGTFDGVIVIYGNYLEAYCCINALIENGVDGNVIKYIKPKRLSTDLKYESNAFHDDAIERKIEYEMRLMNIQIYKDYELEEWNVVNDQVTTAYFVSSVRCVKFKIISMFYYMDKRVNYDTILVINKAGIVFDGEIVIDTKFRTNDPHIFACGTVTKYPRRYYADNYSPKYYNQSEIGRKLGNQIRTEYLNDIPDEDKNNRFHLFCSKTENDLPRYFQPIISYCTLPGNIKYLAIRKPGKPIPQFVEEESDNFRKVCITGNPNNIRDKGYFRLEINDNNQIDLIICLCYERIDLDYYLALWNKHESLLNSLLERYNRGGIKDLFAYFKEPWATALYHPSFVSVLKDSMDILTSFNIDTTNIVDVLYERYKAHDWKKLLDYHLKGIFKHFFCSEEYYSITDVITQFLQFNGNKLDMYVTHTIMQEILRDYEKSPFFEPR